MQLFLNDMGLTSVRCRGLLVPHRAIASVLARSTRPLLFENDDPTYLYTKLGSCTLLAFQKECFVVFAEHQRRGYSPDAIRIVQGFTGGPTLAADTFVVVNPCGGEEIEDLRALKISRRHHETRDLSDFFPLSTQPLPPVQSARMLIAIGTPTETSAIEYEPAHVQVGTVPIACIYERRSLFVAGLHTVRINPSHTASLRLQLDGMSGAPIFSIEGHPGAYVVNFRGTILRGGQWPPALHGQHADLPDVRETPITLKDRECPMDTDLQKFDELLASTSALREDVLADYLTSVLSGIDHAATGTYRSSSGIFWALTRVFGCYDRVVAACEEYSASRADELTFVAALEIEHFLMRLRVLLDEVDYVIRIRLPKTVRGLGQPEGPGPMQYKQFSINKLVKLVDKHPAFYPHLARLLNSNRNNIQTYIELRDDIAHFRAQALIFRGETMSVGFIGSRDTVQSQQAVPHTDLRAYVNNATIWMWRFLQKDVVAYFRARVENDEIGFAPLGIGPHRIGMPGITRFKQVLALPG